MMMNKAQQPNFMTDEEELQRQLAERKNIAQARLAAAQVKSAPVAKATVVDASESAATPAAEAAASEKSQLAGATTAVQGLSRQGTGNTAADVGMGAATGALSGAMIGGPMGAAVGGVIGGGVGLLQAGAAREQRKRDAQAAHFQRIAQIEQEKSSRMQMALQNMGMAMGAAMQVPVVRI
jgi:hypothetical protein